MSTIVITRGLPASGKSTWAKQWVTEGEKRVRINRDDYRRMLFNKCGGECTGAEEQAVTVAQQAAARDFLRKGYSVVVDDTNLRQSYARRWAEIAQQTGADFVVNDAFLAVSVGECIVRDSQRENAVGHKVIEDMYRRYLNSGPLQPVVLETPKALTAPYVGNDFLPDAYIVDIDGTLALMNGRSPYDYSKVRTDLVNECVATVVNTLVDGAHIIVMSGRPDDARVDTIKWLQDNRIRYDKLFMRASGDFRDDAVVKAELFDANVRDNYNVLGVFDDRDRVVRMWRSIGLDCFQVNYGDF